MDSLSIIFANLESLLRELLMLTVYGSIIVITVLVVQKFVGSRLSVKWMYVIWTLAIARFALFVAPPSIISFQNWTASWNQSDPIVTSFDRKTQQQEVGGKWTISEPDLDLCETAIVSTKQFSAYNILAAIWISGCMFLLAKLGIAYRRLQQIVEGSEPAPAPIQNILQQSQQWTRCRGIISLRVTDQIDAPAVAGLLRPVVLIPRWCLQQFNAKQFRCILIHELIHLKRMDIWIQLIAHLVHIVHWFNPLVLLATRKLDIHREMACDQRSTELLTKFNVDEPKRLYGNVILSVATGGNGKAPENNGVLNSALVGSFINPNQQQIRQRITMLVESKPKKPITHLLTIFGVCLMVAVGYTSAQTTSAERPTQPNKPLSAYRLSDEPKIASTQLPSKPALHFPQASAPTITEADDLQSLTLKQSEIKVLRFKERVPALKVQNTEIIQVMPQSANNIAILGTKKGTTDITVELESGRFQTILVQVGEATQQVTIQMKVITVEKSKWDELHLDLSELNSENQAANSARDTSQAKELTPDSNLLKRIHEIDLNSPGVKAIHAPSITTLISHQASFLSGDVVPVVTDNEITHLHVGNRIRITPQPSNQENALLLNIDSHVSKLHDSQIVNVQRFDTVADMQYGNTLVLIDSLKDEGVEKMLIFLATPSRFENP